MALWNGLVGRRWASRSASPVTGPLPQGQGGRLKPPSAPLTVAPAVPVYLCGAIDGLSGAACDRVRGHRGVHMDLSDPSTPIHWPDDDDDTVHRRVS